RIAARTSARAHGIARAFPDATVDVEPEGGTAPEGGIVVNCTPLGLGPEDPLPIGRGRLHPAAHVFDLVYPVTGLVRAAAEAGIPAEHGLELLVAQGARSFRAWTGVEAPVAVMREAIVRELDRRGFPRA
ncbi:MAG: shikimate dehydrogenase, partial [Gemmatimonadetes bacterium]|nr:shikimate dehydrogenase [Gemmatimonadota bacterium]